MDRCASVPNPNGPSKGFARALTNSAVPKFYLFSALGIALSEKQIPQVVENIEN